MASYQDLPPEIVRRVLAKRVLVAENVRPRACIFELLVPEWDLCHCHESPLESSVKLMRIDTYTTPNTSSEATISSKFEHPPSDHIYVPQVMEDPRGHKALGSYYYRELLRTWLSKSTIVISQVKPRLGFLFPELPPSDPWFEMIEQ